MRKTLPDTRQLEHREDLENIGVPANSSLSQVLNQFNEILGNLKVTPESPASQRVVISGIASDRSIGSQYVATFKKKQVIFDGGVIDFQAGQIFAQDGVTLVSTFTPSVLTADQYRYYSISIKNGTTNPDNTVNLELSVGLSSSGNTDLALAPKADFPAGSPLAQVYVQKNSLDTAILDIEYENITLVDSTLSPSNEELNDHTSASTNVHGIGAGSSVVGTATSQTLTNKTITGASIRTPSRSDVKQDTKSNLLTYAATAANGQLCFATDEKILYQVKDGGLNQVSDKISGHIIVNNSDAILTQRSKMKFLSPMAISDNAGTDTTELRVDLATDIEAAAGVLNSKVLTPQTLRSGLRASGSAPVLAARAWVNFNGSTTAIRDSENVSSISDNGVGLYTINFTTAMPNSNYAVIGSARAASDVGGSSGYLKLRSGSTITSTPVATVFENEGDTFAFDSTIVCVAVFS